MNDDKDEMRSEYDFSNGIKNPYFSAFASQSVASEQNTPQEKKLSNVENKIATPSL